MYRQLFSVVVFFLFIGQPCMGEANLRVGPYLQNFTPNSIVIMWETDKPCEGWVEYGSSTALGQKAEGVATCTHEIEIKGLEPATRYYYKVVWEGGESDTTWFKTAPPIGHRNFRFVAYGDSRSDFVTHSKIAQRIIEMDPAFVINSGDLVQRGQDYSQWKPQFFEPLQPLIKNVCIFTVLGNHEGNAPQYYQYLSLPKNGGNEAWWSTDIGNIHLVGLDSNAGYNATAPGSPQYEWLKNDLASTRQEWIIVTFHHPMFSFHPTRGVNQVRWDWQPLFQEMGVDLVLVGHDHHYGRTFPIGPFTNDPARGVVHITSGGGGANLYPVHDFGYSAARRTTYNLVVLDVEGDRIIGRTLDHLGNGLDSFVIDRKTPVTAENFISYEMIQMEKEISGQIAEKPVEEIRSPTQTLKTSLNSSVVFGSTVAATVSRIGESAWKIKANPSKSVLPPQTPLKLEIKAQKDNPEAPVFPLPEVNLKIAADASSRDYRAPILGFRNTDINFMPFRVSQPATLAVPATSRELLIDGVLTAEEWGSSLEVKNFYETRTTQKGMNGVKVHLLIQPEKEILLVGAEMEQSQAVVRKVPYDRADDVYLERNEHFVVRLSDGGTIWHFLVCPNNFGADIRGAESDWDANGFKFAGIPSETGWTAEMAIPLKELPTDLSNLKINLSRFDLANVEIVEWCPTYGEGKESAELFGKLKSD
ncbi:MAG: hypothetical protein AMXMBFR75_13680 [Candidatus Hinthialibacteria bacterium]